MYRKKHNIYRGFGIIHGFKYPLGVLKHIPFGQGDTTINFLKRILNAPEKGKRGVKNRLNVNTIA